MADGDHCIVTRLHYNSMGEIYRWLGSKQQARQLWENEEALKKYIDRLKDFWDEKNQCWRELSDNAAFSKVLTENRE